MDDYTGLDVASARDQIYSLYDQGKKLSWAYNDALQEFWLRLSKQWKAPTAKQFQDEYRKPLYNIDFVALRALFEICRDAVVAYNSLASSFGAPTITDGYFSDSNPDKPSDKGEGTGIGLSAMGEGNKVIMDVDGVEETNKWFKDQFDELIKGYNSLPMNIAFYDPDGSIVASYQTRIKDAVTEIETLAKTVYNKIDAEIAAYRKAVDDAKQAAVQSLNARG